MAITREKREIWVCGARLIMGGEKYRAKTVRPWRKVSVAPELWGWGIGGRSWGLALKWWRSTEAGQPEQRLGEGGDWGTRCPVSQVLTNAQQMSAELSEEYRDVEARILVCWHYSPGPHHSALGSGVGFRDGSGAGVWGGVGRKGREEDRTDARRAGPRENRGMRREHGWKWNCLGWSLDFNDS